MSAATYRRLEVVTVIVMLVGIILMFQPWFRAIVDLFDPLFPDIRLDRTYRTEVAPTILRYGFYGTFFGTIVFIVISHYTYEDIQKARRQKGGLLTFLLFIAPVVFGLGVLTHMAWGHYWSAILAVFNAIFAVAVWNKKQWGFIGLNIFVLIGLGLALAGSGSMPTAVIFVILTLIIDILAWPKRAIVIESSEAPHV